MEYSSSEKSLLKHLKITIFGPSCAIMWSPWATPKTKTLFSSEIRKSDHKLSKTFYFIKISHVLVELWMFFCFAWCFLLKSVISSHNSCAKLAVNWRNGNEVTIFHRQIFVTFCFFFLSSLVTGPSFMSISSLVQELWQFPFIRDWLEIQKSEIPPPEFWKYLKT